MTIIPAIDLLGGACVRLYKGDYDQSTVYDTDPLEQAMRFKAAGARRIHLVDLDAARDQGKHNREVIRKLVEHVDAQFEVGGGIRSEDDVKELVDAGVRRLVVGTAFARDPSVLRRWTERFGRIFIAGIDAYGGKVRISGWEEDSGISDMELAAMAAGNGAVSIIYTNIERDGTLTGPDIERTRLLADASGLPLIVSGGIRGEDDFRTLFNDACKGIVGVIVGKALYEKRFDLKRVLALYQHEAESESETSGPEW
jgi:phosphoribosylformimino-5-aminoimidazole carboxamide ribotide isomerase